MTSHEGKCDLSSILAMSCHQRAQAFADRLRSRLTSLDSEELNGGPHETSWLSSHKDSVAISQPKHSSDFNFYLNLVSPGSPVDETTPNLNDDFISINTNGYQNKDDLLSHVTSQYDSDSSDGPFFDCQGDLNYSNKTECNNVRAQHKHKDNETNEHNFLNETVVEEEENSVTANGEEEADTDEIVITQNGETQVDMDENVVTQNGEKEADTDETLLTENGEKEAEAEESSITQNGEKGDDVDETSKNLEDIVIDDSVVTQNGDVQIEKGEQPEKETLHRNQTRSEVFLNGTREVDDDEPEERIPRVRRCSSLKTGKTPPGTPGHKKIVRFADVFGLDLADVRTFLDEIPKIPISAFNDLVDVDIKSSESVLSAPSQTHTFITDKILVPLFQQPGGLPNFVDRLRDNQVCLDCALVEDPTTCLIRGIVRVKNLDFHKSVHVRYTIDSWQTFTDVQASYIQNSCDGFSDKFSFLLYANSVVIGGKFEFAVRFQCKGCQYWDNNNGINYIFQCLPGTTATINALEDSLSTFY